MIRSIRRVDVHQMGVFYIKYALVENIKQHREPSDGHEVASQVHGGRDFRMTKASRPSGTAGKSVWAPGKTSGGDAPPEWEEYLRDCHPESCGASNVPLHPWKQREAGGS